MGCTLSALGSQWRARSKQPRNLTQSCSPCGAPGSLFKMDSGPHPHLPSESPRGGPSRLCFTRSLGNSVLRFKKLWSNSCFQKVTVAACGAGTVGQAKWTWESNGI